jgi:hypothetical protein
MQGKKKGLRTLGIILFAAGILGGMVLFIFMNWAYFEAYFYFGYSAPADKPLTTLRCPLLMTTSDTGQVTIRLTNNTSMDLEPSISTDISNANVSRTIKFNYPIAAGKTRKESWAVTSNDMVFGHLILARVYVFSTYTMPSRANTCGTVMVNLPWISGTLLFILALVFILACLAAGWYLWLGNSRPFQSGEMTATRAMALFTVAVVLGLTAGIAGWWLLGLICAVICLLLTLVVTVYYLQRI